MTPIPRRAPRGTGGPERVPSCWEAALREGLPLHQQSWVGTWEVLPETSFLCRDGSGPVSPIPRVPQPSCSLGGGLKGSGRLCVSLVWPVHQM